MAESADVRAAVLPWPRAQGRRRGAGARRPTGLGDPRDRARPRALPRLRGDISLSGRRARWPRAPEGPDLTASQAWSLGEGLLARLPLADVDLTLGTQSWPQGSRRPPVPNVPPAQPNAPDPGPQRTARSASHLGSPPTQRGTCPHFCAGSRHAGHPGPALEEGASAQGQRTGCCCPEWVQGCRERPRAPVSPPRPCLGQRPSSHRTFGAWDTRMSARTPASRSWDLPPSRVGGRVSESWAPPEINGDTENPKPCRGPVCRGQQSCQGLRPRTLPVPSLTCLPGRLPCPPRSAPDQVTARSLESTPLPGLLGTRTHPRRAELCTAARGPQHSGASVRPRPWARGPPSAPSGGLRPARRAGTAPPRPQREGRPTPAPEGEVRSPALSGSSPAAFL